MFTGIRSAFIKLWPLIVDSNLSLSINFILGFGAHIEVVLFSAGDSFTALVFLIDLRPWLELVGCAILMLIVITTLEFPKIFLKFTNFFLKLFFLLVNSFEFVKSIVIDGLELLFCLLFVLFDFLLEFFILVLKFRDFLEF